MIDSKILKNLTDPHFKAAFAEPLDTVIRLSADGIFFNFLSEYLSTLPVTIYFQKDSYLSKTFDDKVQLMVAAGLTEYWIHQEWKAKSVKINTNSDPKVMSVSDLALSFYLCLCGLGISFVVFISELLLYKVTEKRRKRKIRRTNKKFPQKIVTKSPAISFRM
jgi:hypothetical protein